MLVVVNKFSKMAILIPCKKNTTSQQISQLFFKHVWKYFVLPTIIISDRDGRFIITFWKTLWKYINTRLSLLKDFHPQTGRQMKVVNRLVVQLLRMYNHKHRQTWDDNLSHIQQNYNHAQHNSTCKSPFEIYYVFQPSTPINLISSSTHSNDTDYKG